MTRKKVAVIIPTRNRSEDLRRCLRSLQAQSSTPNQVIVSDSSDTDETRIECERFSREVTEFSLRYVRSQSMGASVQRNLAISVLPEDVDYVLLADDDVIFDPHYLTVLTDILDEDAVQSVVGVSGIAQRQYVQVPAWYRAYLRVFLLGDARFPGRVLVSGVNMAPSSEGACTDADWLFGCAMYRRGVFAHVRFAEGLRGYSLYDDVDFSMYARTHGRLVVCPQALLDHRHSALARPSAAAFAEMEVVNRYWLVLRHLPAIESRFAYWWSVIGLLVMHAARALARRAEGATRLMGTLKGVGIVLKSKGRLLE